MDLAYLTELTYFSDPVDPSVDCGKEGAGSLKACLDNYFTANNTKASTGGLPYEWQVLNVSIPMGRADKMEPA